MCIVRFSILWCRSKALPWVLGTGEQRYLFQDNKRTNVWVWMTVYILHCEISLGNVRIVVCRVFHQLSLIFLYLSPPILLTQLSMTRHMTVTLASVALKQPHHQRLLLFIGIQYNTSPKNTLVFVVVQRSSRQRDELSLKVLVINYHSVVDKKPQMENLIDSTQADIILGT